MRLKEVKWDLSGTGSDLNLFRGGQLIATIPKNTAASLDLLFQPNQTGTFVTSGFLRLSFWWKLVVKWEVVSFAVPANIPTEVKSEIEYEPLKPEIKEREVEIQPQLQARPKRKLTERIMSVFKRGQS